MEPPRPRSTAITLAFDEFGWKELQAEARGVGVTVEALIERAVDEFVGELSAGAGGSLALEVPDASRGARAGKTVSTTIELSAEQLSALQEEAERQEVPAPRLAEHAVIRYLARRDTDGGAG